MEELPRKLYPSAKNYKNYSIGLQSSSGKNVQKTSILSDKLTKDEEALLSLAVNEYNDYLPNILTVKTQDFIPNVAKYIKITSQAKGIDCNEQSLNKVLKVIRYKYYEKEYARVNEIIQSITNIDSYKKFKGSNYIPHCNRCKGAIHTCGDKFYHFPPYLLCLKCQKIYDQTCVLLFCKECQVEYYSSIETATKSNVDVYKPATWDKYHCNIVINDVMKCYKCQNVLYINTTNTSNKALTCLKCKIEFDQLDIQWTCVICNNNFVCEAKVYNPLEYKTMKMVVKETIVKGIEAKPDSVECCQMTEDEINKATFRHKKNCNGILYLGYLNNKKVVVCELCQMLYNYDAHLWQCPICKHRFKLNETTAMPNATGNMAVKEDSGSKTQRDLRQSMPCGFERETPNTEYKRIARRRHISSQEPITEKMLEKEEVKEKDDRLLKSSMPLRKVRTKIENKREDEGDDTNKDSKYKISMRDNKKRDYLSKSQTEEELMSAKINNNNNNDNTVSKGVIPNIAGNPNVNLNINIANLANNRDAKNINIRPNQRDNNNNNKQAVLQKPEGKQPLQRRRSVLIGDFKSEDYAIIKQIGQGTFGKIYEVEDKTKRKFAMKKILTNSLDEVTALINEYEMLKSLSSSCKNGLVNIHGMQTKILDKTTHAMYVLMDLAVRDWEKEIERRSIKKTFYTEQELIRILQGLTYTFAELQRHNISHRDIKPQNILLLEDGSFRIADFGEAKRVIQTSKKPVRQTIRGTELYMSPILFHALKAKGISEKYTEHNTFKSDVFSLGLCFILAATLTFNSLVSIRELEDMISIKMSLGRYLKGRYTNKLMDVLYYMIELDEKLRLDFVDLEKYVEKL